MTTTPSSRAGLGDALRAGLVDALQQSAAVEELRKAAGQYAAAQTGRVVDKVGDRLGKLTDDLDKVAETGSLGFVGETGRRIAGRASPVKAGAVGAMMQVKDKVGGRLGEKVKSRFGRGSGGSGQPETEAAEEQPEEPQAEAEEEREQPAAEAEEREEEATRELEAEAEELEADEPAEAEAEDPGRGTRRSRGATRRKLKKK
jgi:hypothetical protein